ncbi:MAG: S41 family peptidase [Myxococcota bacterium]
MMQAGSRRRRTARVLARSGLMALALSLALVFACRADEAPGSSADADEGTSLASQGGGVPLDGEPNRAGVPTTGKNANLEGRVADDEEDEEESKDYWAPIDFDRTNFEEVRSFVRERYIETDVDKSRAFAQAASFALGSDEDHQFLLLPESFYDKRKGHPDEKGLLSGEKTKLKPSDRFVLLERVEAEEDEEEGRLSDDEIRELRDKAQARQRMLDEAWKEAGFGPREFDRVMSFAAKELGESEDWTMKKAWVAAAQGYLYSLDPHSSLIAKAAWEDSTKEITDSSFEGIGAILTRRQGSEYTIVESPIEGQPAVQAGLRAGDVILQVDGDDIKGELLPKVVSRIRGEKGTHVVLTVRREGVPDPMDIEITRSRIDIKNVQGKMVKGHDAIGYIKVTGFVPTTNRELGRVYDELREEAGGELRGLVLDLRNNSGGLLKQGIEVADRFLRNGNVVTVKNRTESDETYRAEPDGTWDVPLVVLVNDGSASASEIVASAIQDNGRGLVIGDRTFGKASVQTLFSPLLRDDYYIKLTVARYYSPNDRTLQVIGVQPDLEVPPEIDGEMPVGFREENLSHHLAPLDAEYESKNKAWAATVKECADDRGIARRLYEKNPNPAVKFDFQRMRAADLLECMSSDKRSARRNP